MVHLQATCHSVTTTKPSSVLGADLQIYSDGTDGYIDNVTGDFYIRDTTGGTLHLQAKIGEEGIVIHDDGGVNLYRNNALKLATTSTGIDVTGNANFADNGKAIFGAGSDLQIYHNGGNSFVQDTGARVIYI